MTVSCGKKIMVPGMPGAIFLESVVVRDTTFETLEEVIDNRGSSRNAALVGLRSIVPRVGVVEGSMHQAWKAVSSRLNHLVIIGDMTLQYQEKRGLIFFSRMMLSW
jgi:hypothetical protein